MTDQRPARSLASVEASRRNGALSKGPKTALGKLKASQSSRKHGLFRAELLTGATLENPGDDLAGLASPGRASWLDLADQTAVVRIAAAQLDEATRLVGLLREKLGLLLQDRTATNEDLEAVLKQIGRMARYQRRFRGKRDRALRRLISDAARPSP